MILDELGRALNGIFRAFSPEKVSVIIPCYNEERTLGAVIREAKKSPIVQEVVVIDDDRKTARRKWR